MERLKDNGAPKKIHPKPQGIDRISHLPDDVLIRILSLLETKYAVRTTALSREWRRRRMWVHVYNLSFDFSSASVDSEIQSVDRTLDLHRADKITRFSLHIQDGKYEDEMLVKWLGFAVTRHVEVLSLLLPGHEYGRWPFELPEFLFSHDSLRELTTMGCNIFIPGKVCWGLLRVLDVGFADLVEIENLLTRCLSLEYLRLHNVFMNDGQNIDITQKKLKKLVIEEPYCDHGYLRDREVRVAAPQLEELEILGRWYSITCKLVDAPNLVHVHLDFSFLTSWDDHDEMCENVEKEMELLQKVRQILRRNELPRGQDND